MRKIICIVIAAMMLPLSVFAQNATEADVLPAGDIQEHKTVTVTLEGDTQGVELFEKNDDESDLEFYSYGSEYAYDDMQYRSNAEGRRGLYNALLRACKRYSSSYDDYFGDDQINSIPSTFMSRYPEQVLNITKYGLDENEIYEVYFTFRNDHPEYYWLSNYCVPAYGSNNTSYLLVIFYGDYKNGTDRRKMDNKIDEEVKKFLLEIGETNPKSDYDKAKVAHDLIADEVEYGYDDNGIPLDTSYAHTIVGVFDGNSDTDVVCEGYAKAFQLLMNAEKVDNIYVVGNGYNGVSWGGHAWNMAKMDDGNYYWFDVTWDDGKRVNYDYFAKGKSFEKDHMMNTVDMTGVNFLYAVPEVTVEDYVPEIPTDTPTQVPVITEAPTAEPTDEPSEIPTTAPTAEPTDEPSETPTTVPTLVPTDEPSEMPTTEPTDEPSETPIKPTHLPLKEMVYTPVSIEGTVETIEIEFKESVEDCRAMVAVYDDSGILIGLTVSQIVDNKAVLSFDKKGAYKCRIYSWYNGTDSPVSLSETL